MLGLVRKETNRFIDVYGTNQPPLDTDLEIYLNPSYQSEQGLFPMPLQLQQKIVLKPMVYVHNPAAEYLKTTSFCAGSMRLPSYAIGTADDGAKQPIYDAARSDSISFGVGSTQDEYAVFDPRATTANLLRQPVYVLGESGDVVVNEETNDQPITPEGFLQIGSDEPFDTPNFQSPSLVTEQARIIKFDVSSSPRAQASTGNSRLNFTPSQSTRPRSSTLDGLTLHGSNLSSAGSTLDGLTLHGTNLSSAGSTLDGLTLHGTNFSSDGSTLDGVDLANAAFLDLEIDNKGIILSKEPIINPSPTSAPLYDPSLKGPFSPEHVQRRESSSDRRSSTPLDPPTVFGTKGWFEVGINSDPEGIVSKDALDALDAETAFGLFGQDHPSDQTGDNLPGMMPEADGVTAEPEAAKIRRCVDCYCVIICCYIWQYIFIYYIRWLLLFIYHYLPYTLPSFILNILPPPTHPSPHPPPKFDGTDLN